jgi:hypothetical protein
MSQDSIRMDPDFISILAPAEFNNFTVLEMRGAYLALPAHRGLDKNKAQRTVYRQICRLTSKGLLQRNEGKSIRQTRYEKTALFFASELSGNRKVRLKASNTGLSAENGTDNSQLIKLLVEKLQQYKLELLTGIGESEEYKSLYSSYPHLRDHLQESYNTARDNCSKLLGRVRALETLIEQQKKMSPT